MKKISGEILTNSDIASYCLDVFCIDNLAYSGGSDNMNQVIHPKTGLPFTCYEYMEWKKQDSVKA